jgi:uncharacterized lipoprotein YbaY
MSHVVKGEVLLPAAGVREQTGDVHVYVEDISRADAPAIIAGEIEIKAAKLRPGATLPFTVEVPGKLDDRRIYSVRAHIDVTGSGDVTKGDLVSTQTYPVLTRGHGSSARVIVKPV